MSTGDTNSFENIIGRLREEFATPGELILPTPLGPISVENLTNLKGWTYDLDYIGAIGAETPIIRGAAPNVLAQYTDEKGWLQSLNFAFRSPFIEMHFTADNHRVSASPFLLNLGGLTVPNNMTIYNNVYNPMSVMGPLYGVSWNPSCSWPYERLVEISVSLPATAPVAQANMIAAAIGRIKINDYRTFMRSIKKFNLEQMSGVKIDRFP